MNILALETSSAVFSLAVLSQGKIVAEKKGKSQGILSESIIPAIGQTLKRARLSLKDLDGFAVGLGPGSFTSLRVGLSTVKALSFALAKPVAGIPSFDALVEGAVDRKDFSHICALADARRNLFYVCLYEKSAAKIERKTDYLLISLKDLFKKIKIKTLFAGDGLKLAQDNIKRALGSKAVLAKEALWYPQAKSTALLAQKRFEKKDFDSADTLIPIYLYPDDCQIEKDRKKG